MQLPARRARLTGGGATPIVNSVVTEQAVLNALRTLKDPGQQQDIVSLGLVRDLAIDPRLSPISRDPRFLSLLQKSGLTYSPGRPRS